MSAGVCRSCSAPVLWMVSESSGRRVPLDAVPTPDGNVTIEPDGRAHYLRSGETSAAERYTSHFATCPEATTWRRSKGTTDATQK